MKKYSLATVFVTLLCFAACQKDAQIEHKSPRLTAYNAKPLATVANFSWMVDFPGKMSSVVKVSRNADMSDAVSFGDDAPTLDKVYYATATGLTKTTTYYYQFEAWNPGVSYTSEVFTFTTLDEGLAVVTTSVVTNIGNTSATGGGNVTYDGNHSVTERGICWGTSHNPTVNGNHASSGTGTGSFTVSMTNLTASTKYYVRAYATNSIGTNYGEEVSFTTSDTPPFPEGAIDGVFSVSASKKVYFSQGNLQYQASTGKWQFAANQYDCIGETNSNISSSYSGWIDLFGWGTSGWNSGANCYQPWSKSEEYRDYYPGGSYTNNLTGNYANADWGVYNKITNGGNQAGLWRTLTRDEWVYVFNTRNTASSIRYAKACVNSQNGVILLPDDWSASYYSLNSTNSTGASFTSNNITASQWASLEQHGAVFLPAAGERGTSVNLVGSGGLYWSASCSHEYSAYGVYFYVSVLNPQCYCLRIRGQSVRLVRSAQ